MPVCSPETWELIKAEYIAGGMSYSKLADKYGVNKSSISRRATAQGWQQLLQRVRNETETKVAELVSDENAARFDKMFTLADKVQYRIEQLMELPVRNGRDAHDLVDALNGTVKLLRDLYGIPDEQQLQGRERLRIMREDLALKQKQQAVASGEDKPVQKWIIDYSDEQTDGEQDE